MNAIPSIVPDAQAAAMRSLERQGFRFCNWIPASPDADNEAQDEYGCAIMKRTISRISHQYREVDPQGNIN